MSGKKVPHCSRCDSDHFNFAPCNPRQDIKPEVLWKTGDAWGNQMRDLKVMDGNTFVQRREFDR